MWPPASYETVRPCTERKRLILNSLHWYRIPLVILHVARLVWESVPFQVHQTIVWIYLLHVVWFTCYMLFQSLLSTIICPWKHIFLTFEGVGSILEDNTRSTSIELHLESNPWGCTVRSDKVRYKADWQRTLKILLSLSIGKARYSSS